MKKIIIPILLILSLIVAQTGPTNYNELIKLYPQLSVNKSNIYNQNNPTQSMKFDFTDYTDSELLMLDSLGVLSTLLDTIAVEKPIYFGYDFFNTPDKFAIFDNIPIPGNYHLGPGDQLIISIWGATQFRSRHMISREGDIFIDGVGQVNLAGVNISTAENMLKEKFSEVYSTIKGRRPSTFLSVTLGQLKSMNISFVGEVNRPGIHAVHPFSDITTALLQASGVDSVGSLRNIQVIRDNNIISNFDFYEFLVNGITSQNIRLANGDVIFVPTRKSSVEIEGEVNRPGVYEAKNGESIYNLLNHAGGLTQRAQSKIEVYQLLPRDKRPSEDFAYNVSFKNFEETDRDLADNLVKIRVLSVPDVTREVSILGQIKSPGKYAYDDSMKILDLLKIAGGLDDKTFIESIYIQEAELIRIVPNSIYPKRIPLDLKQLINDPTKYNIELHNQDIVLIRENRKNSNPKYVTINGEVNIPGKYTIQKKEESLENIINRAGGFSENAFVDGLQMYRDSMQVVLNEYNVFVADGDSIYVPEPPGVVYIGGAVNRGGLVQFVNGKSLRYYIEKAGGFRYNANKRNISVQYANGNVRQKKSFLTSLLSISPPVRDGSKVVVYTKAPKPPFEIAQFLSIASSTATSIITLYLIYENNKN